MITAELKPLSGKYYGTEIILYVDGEEAQTIKVWDANKVYEPSVRELQRHGYTRKQWDENALVDDGWGGKYPIREADLMCDSHYEDHGDYLVAMEIVKSINCRPRC